MLDVHAPHGATHNWRDFVIHIAAIAIGLLLALTLEKLTEYLHERHLLTEARHELATEMAENRSAWQANVAEAARIQQSLAKDLVAIQAARSHAATAGTRLDYSVGFHATRDGPWQAARQSGSLALMPHDELQQYAWFHGILASEMDAMHAFETTLQIGGAIAASAPLETLNSRDLDDLASRTMEAQGRLENLKMFLGFEATGLDGTIGRPAAR